MTWFQRFWQCWTQDIQRLKVQRRTLKTSLATNRSVCCRLELTNPVRDAKRRISSTKFTGSSQKDLPLAIFHVKGNRALKTLDTYDTYDGRLGIRAFRWYHIVSYRIVSYRIASVRWYPMIQIIISDERYPISCFLCESKLSTTKDAYLLCLCHQSTKYSKFTVTIMNDLVR